MKKLIALLAKLLYTVITRPKSVAVFLILAITFVMMMPLSLVIVTAFLPAKAIFKNWVELHRGRAVMRLMRLKSFLASK